MNTLRTGNILPNGQPEVIHLETNENNIDLSQDKLEILIQLLTKLKNDSNYQELLNQLFK